MNMSFEVEEELLYTDSDYGQYIFLDEKCDDNLWTLSTNQVVGDAPKTLFSKIVIEIQEVLEAKEVKDDSNIYGKIHIGGKMCFSIPDSRAHFGSVKWANHFVETTWHKENCTQNLNVSIRRKRPLIYRDNVIGVARISLSDLFAEQSSCTRRSLVVDLQKKQKAPFQFKMLKRTNAGNKRSNTAGHLRLRASIFHFTGIQSCSLAPDCKYYNFFDRKSGLGTTFSISLSSQDAKYYSKECTITAQNSLIGKAKFNGKLHSLDPRLTIDTCLQADVTLFNSLGHHVATISQLFDFEESTAHSSKSSLLLTSHRCDFPIEGHGQMHQTSKNSRTCLYFYSCSFKTAEVNAAGQINMFIDKNKGAERNGFVEVGTTEHCSADQAMLLAAGVLLLHRNMRFCC